MPRKEGIYSAVALAVAVVWVLVAGAWAATSPVDLDGLLQFRGNVSNANLTALVSWVDGTDPCAGGWTGVACTCGSVGLPVTACNDAPDASGFQRVLALNLGPTYQGSSQSLQGNLSDGLGQLTALLALDLSSNNLM